MAHTLLLLKEFTPNIKGHPYFFIKYKWNYVNYLRTSQYLSKRISSDNYRLNANILKLKHSAFDTNDNITYIVEYDESHLLRCYHVNSVTIQSDMVIFGLSIDYWGSYFDNNLIDYAHVTRCNRNIGVGIYDDIKIGGAELANDFKQLYFRGEAYPTRPTGPKNYITSLNTLVLCIQLAYNAKQATLGSEKVSAQDIFCIDLKTIIDKYKEQYGGTDTDKANFVKDKTIFDFINDLLGGIYSVVAKAGVIYGSNDAEVMGAWLLPTDLVSTAGDAFAPIIKVKSRWHKYNETTQNEYEFDTFAISHGITQQKVTILENDYDINYDYVIGTNFNEGLHLARLTTNELYATYVSEVRASGISVYIKQGESQFNISSQFVYEIVGNNASVTPLRRIANIGTQITSAIKGGIKSYSSLGGLGVGLTAINQVANLVQGYGVSKEVKGSGDAFTTYNEKDAYYSLPSYHLTGAPFCVNMFKSVQNEKLHARFYGAQFDISLDTLDGIFNSDLLGEGNYDLTFVICDEIKINNLPAMARTEIENAFASGVELFDYEGTASE